MAEHLRLVEGISQLRLRALENGTGVRMGRTATAAMRQYIDRAVRRGSSDGYHQCLIGPHGVRAHITGWHDPQCWYGSPTTYWLLDAAPQDPEALEWLSEQLDSMSEAFGADTDITLLGDAPLPLPLLLKRGLGIDSVQWVGSVAEGLDRLVRSGAAGARPDVDFARKGVGVVQFAPEHRDEVLQLKADIFRAHPEFCWFGANLEFQRQEREELGEASPKHFRCVLVNEQDQVRGYAGARVEQNPYWGSVAGMDLVLAPELQGQGLARSLYRVVLSELALRGVARFKGGTSQPGVLALSRVMGRRRLAITLRRGTHFPPEHFGLDLVTG